MRTLFLYLSLLLLIGNLSAQAQSNGRFGALLQDYNKLLPLEKIYVHTDHSFYEPGDDIWFKAYLANEKMRPGQLSPFVRAELIDPIGNKLSEIKIENIGGSCNGDFKIPANGSGGIYKIRCYTTWQKNFGDAYVFEKNITVQKVVFPNLLMKLDFMRESYGPGSQVVAKVDIRSKDNFALANKACKYVVNIAGKAILKGNFNTDDLGTALVQFSLPQDLNSSDGLLNIMIEHDGNTESISRSIPIVTRNISVQFLPEGGEFLLGTENRIAFRAVDEFGKPVDISGRIINQAGQEVLCFESYHQGMGSFLLTPKKGESYSAQISEPAKIEKKYSLPTAKAQGVAIRLEAQEKDKLRINVYSSSNQALCIIAQGHGQVHYEMGLNAVKGDNAIEIPTQQLPVGITQLTIFDAKEQPLCERLAFVNKDRQIKVQVSTDQSSYQTRDKVDLTILVTDETGKGVPGDFSMAVVDDKTWTFADDKQDNILSYLLMSSELRGKIYEPNFYFDANENKADTALDYVMLTNGWRRFEWKKMVDKNAAKDWQAARKIEPDPQEAIAGTIKFNGSPLKGATITVKSTMAGDTAPIDLVLHSDQNGKFYYPNLHTNQNKPVNVVAHHRGFKSNVYYSNYNSYQSTGPKKKAEGIRFQKKQYNMDPASPSQRYYKVDELTGNQGILRGIVSDENGEPIAFATVLLQKPDGSLYQGASSNLEGEYAFTKVPAGSYKLSVKFVGYENKEYPSVQIRAGQVLHQNVILFNPQMLLESVEIVNEIQVVGQRPALIEMDRTTSGQTLTKEDIQKMATRDISSIRATTAGISQKDLGEESSKSGSRHASNELYVDGLRVVGNANLDLPPRKDNSKAIEQVKGKTTTVNPITAAPPANFRAEELRGKKAVAVQKVELANNSNQFEMNRLAGKASKNVRNNDRNQVVSGGEFTQANAQLKLEVSQFGQPPYQASRVYIAPDYSEFVAVRKRNIDMGIVRNDFRNTIFWQPNVQTDSNGQAKISFYNSDAVTTFRIIVEGMGTEGQVGRCETTYSVVMPFEIDVKIPKTLSFGDTLRMPVILKNSTANRIDGSFQIQVPACLKLLLDSIPNKLSIEANSFVVLQIPYMVLPSLFEGKLMVEFSAEGISDSRTVELEVIAKGFPTYLSLSGNQTSRRASFEINDLIDGSLVASFEAYPSVLEDLQKSMESMLREPHGCFEQTSSSTYPNIMALQYMKASNSLNPGVYQKAMGYIERGYGRLASYESAGGGFEWFGASPAHEGLTAFGLLEFKEMSEVFGGVNQAMIDRAQKWLLSRRKGDGGWTLNPRALHSWTNSKVMDAYITYALVETGISGMQKELATIVEEAQKSKDLYRMGLACNALFAAGNQPQAETLLLMLQSEIESYGVTKVKAEHSVTNSYGSSLGIEILALAAQASMRSKNVNEARVKSYIDALLAMRNRGYFGSTQATVQALKALVMYAKLYQNRAEQTGNLVLYINGQKILEQKVSSHQKEKIEVKGLDKYLSKGSNEVELRFEGMKEGLPYALNVEWTTKTPAADSESWVQLSTQLQDSKVKVGETLRLEAVLTNVSKKDAPNAMALIGIPAGLSLQPWQLKEMLEKGVADFYEIRGNYLVLYYRNLAAGKSQNISLDLKAEVPGTYQAPASSAYLYYDNEFKHWYKGEQINVEL